MNLPSFGKNLPANYEAIILHEFEHALGFLHEHQSPIEDCQSQFRLLDDQGYLPTRAANNALVADKNGKRPGIISVLINPPYSWSPDVVKQNIYGLLASSAYEAGPFDPQSIMAYHFEPWLFKDPTSTSSCNSPMNLQLSAFDKQGAAKVYPYDAIQIQLLAL